MTLSLFPINSRYAGAQTGRMTLPDGTQAVYVLRRFVPPASRFARVSVEEAQAIHRAAAHAWVPEEMDDFLRLAR